MPSLILPDVPAELISGLSQLAETRRLKLLERAVRLLQESLVEEVKDTPERLPMNLILDEAIIPERDIPDMGSGERVPFVEGGIWLPDPVLDAEE